MLIAPGYNSRKYVTCIYKVVLTLTSVVEILRKLSSSVSLALRTGGYYTENNFRY